MPPPTPLIQRVAFRLLTVSGTACICLFCLLFFTHSAQADNDPDTPGALGSIAGIVTNITGTPLSDINVYVSAKVSYASYMAKTDVNGRYKVPLVPTGIYYVGLSDPTDQYASEYYSQARTVMSATEVIVTGNPVTGINASLAVGGRLTGTVTLEHEGPVAAGLVHVYVNQGAGWEPAGGGVITATGQYTTFALLPGVYRLCAEIYTGGTYLVGCYGGATLTEATDIALAAGEIKTNLAITIGQKPFNGEIGGQVTGDGNPQQGIKVSLYNGSLETQPFVYVFTDSAGRYLIGGLSAGAYRLRFSDPAGLYATAFYTDAPSLADSTTVVLTAGQSISNINLALRRAGTLQGTVHQTEGEPHVTLYAVLFQASDSTGSAYWQELGLSAPVDASGHYTLTGLWPGVYRVGICLSSPFCDPLEYYGSKTTVDIAKDVQVQAGQISSGIDITLGRENPLFFPLISDVACDLMCKLAEINDTTGDFKTFLHILQATGLAVTLSDPDGSYTIFAPTDAAFAAQPAGTLEQWLAEPTGQLNEIARFHVLNYAWYAYEFFYVSSLSTLQGNTLAFENNCDLIVDCSVKVNGAVLITTDILASNGVIHVIDRVLLPPEQ